MRSLVNRRSLSSRYILFSVRKAPTLVKQENSGEACSPNVVCLPGRTCRCFVSFHLVTNALLTGVPQDDAVMNVFTRGRDGG